MKDRYQYLGNPQTNEFGFTPARDKIPSTQTENFSPTANSYDRVLSLQDIVTSRDIPLLQARALILDELNLADAPLTGRQIGCVLQTATAMYSGHNYEHNYAITFESAEECAIQAKIQAEPDEPIQRIILGGRGMGKIKRLAPYAEAYETLTPHFNHDTELVLLQPDTFNQAVVFTADEHHAAYAPQPYSIIEDTDRQEIITELERKTILTGEGLELVTDLRQLGLNTGIQFFLTGSASGRCGISQFILKKEKRSYEDIDLIAVTDHDRADVEMTVEGIINPYFGTLNKRLKEIQLWFINETRWSTDYYSNDRDVVSLTVAPSLRQGMIRMDYLRKNFFHQIS